MLPNNVGWGPRQSIHVVHDTDAPTKLTLYNPERWDTVYEGAPEAGIKVNSAIQEQQLIILFQVRQRKQVSLEFLTLRVLMRLIGLLIIILM